MSLSDLALYVLGIKTNRDVLRGKMLFTKLVDRAQSRVCIVSGNLSHTFYNDAEVLETFRRAHGRGVEIEIIHGPNINENSQAILRLNQEGIVRLYRFPERPKHHFVVVDEKHIRVEDFHLEGQAERQAYFKNNTMYLAKKLTMRFAYMKSQSVREQSEGT